MTDLEFHWENYRTNKSESSRDYLCNNYEYLVGATRIKMFPGFKEWQDIEQEGIVALLDAIKHYDPSKGAKFPTYAIYCIRRRYSKMVNKDNLRTKTIISDYNSCEEISIAECGRDESVSPEEQVIFTECRQFVSEQVASLPPHLEEVMRKRYWEEKTLRQVAVELGRSAPSILGRERTGFKKLRTSIPEDIFSR